MEFEFQQFGFQSSANRNVPPLYVLILVGRDGHFFSFEVDMFPL